MKRILILLCLTLVSCLQQPERDCTAFRTGKFRFEQDIKGIKHVTVFERTDSLQIETYEGRTDTAVIRWVNDCEYVLRKKHPRNRAEKEAIDMKILTTSKNSYTFEFGILGKNETKTGTAVKIN